MAARRARWECEQSGVSSRPLVLAILRGGAAAGRGSPCADANVITCRWASVAVRREAIRWGRAARLVGSDEALRRYL
jgi:hypothetical protein